MKTEHYFHNCSKEYITHIDPQIFPNIEKTIMKMPKYKTQTEINHYLFKKLTRLGWSYDSLPPNIGIPKPPNQREQCRTTTTIDAKWHSDFGKEYGDGLVHIEAQFGTVEAMFKDFLGFRIAYYERRLKLGIEIVLLKPNEFFSHRKKAIAGMAYFDIARKTLAAIGLDCPIWIVGIFE